MDHHHHSRRLKWQRENHRVPETSDLPLLEEAEDKAEGGLVAFEADGADVVGGSVIVRECGAFLVLEEDARHSSLCEGIVVAVGCKVSAVEPREESHLAVH